MSAPLTLALDAATYVGTVAVACGRDVLASGETRMRGREEERLMPAVADVLREAGVAVGDLSQVVCGAGPGSFTSLRIAAAIAKGIAAGRGLPLMAVSSLALVVAGSEWEPVAGRYLAILDAMRGDVFVAAYEVSAAGAFAEVAPATVLPRGEVTAAAVRLGARPIGPAEPLAAAPHARGVARLVAESGSASRLVAPVSLDAWEPTYGRLAEAQVKWERAHGRPLDAVPER